MRHGHRRRPHGGGGVSRLDRSGFLIESWPVEVFGGMGVCPYVRCVRTIGGVKKSARLEVRLEEGLLARLPSGGRERSAFVRWALEQALGSGESPRSQECESPASARASDLPLVEVEPSPQFPPGSTGELLGTGEAVRVAPAARKKQPLNAVKPPARPVPSLPEEAPVGDAPSAVQLMNRAGVPLSVAERWLQSGEWRLYW